MLVSDDYKELAREANDLRNDLTRHSHAAKFAAGANKTAIDDLKQRVEKVEERLHELEKREAVNEERVQGLMDARKEHTGKISTLEKNEAKDIAGTEKKKAQWGLYSAVAVAVLSGLASLAVQLLKMLGGGD
jgi:chromosome segregation ATPase